MASWMSLYKRFSPCQTARVKQLRSWLLIPLVLICLGACQSGGSDSGSPTPSPNPSSTPSPSAVPEPRAEFFGFGDWGTGTPSQFEVAAAVEADCASRGCDFGLLLGDNFYPTGVSSVADPQWQDKFENVYDGLAGPFYAVLGNHDYDGNEQAQVDYTATQSRWRLPARSYSIRLPEGAAEPLLEIFVIDSNAFGPSAATALQNALDASNATWKLLALHHPIYSNGLHGDDSAGINALLVPVICNRVDAVLAGHDHLFSHLDDPNDGCAFRQFVIGTGGKDLYPANSDPRVLYSESTFGFARFELEPQRMSLEFRRSDGSLAYSFEANK